MGQSLGNNSLARFSIAKHKFELNAHLCSLNCKHLQSSQKLRRRTAPLVVEMGVRLQREAGETKGGDWSRRLSSLEQGLWSGEGGRGGSRRERAEEEEEGRDCCG